MTSKMSRLSGLCFAAVIAVVAVSEFGCAPAVKSLNHNAAPVQAGPHLQDVAIDIKDDPSALAPVVWDADVTSAVVFRLSENILSLHDTLPEKTRAEWTKNLWQGLPRSDIRISASPYAEMLIEQTQDKAKDELKNAMPQLKEAPGKIQKALNSLKPPVNHGENLSLNELSRRAFQFMRDFKALLPNIGLMSAVESALKSELDRYLALEPAAQSTVNSLNAAKNINAAITPVLSFLSRAEISLPNETKTKIESARKLGASVDRFQNASEALSVLVDIWEMLAPSERESVFKKANADLYDYFKGQDKEGLKCLQGKGFCPITWFQKKVAVEPKLEAFGLEKLRSLLNEKGASAVREEVAEALTSELSQLPKIISEMVQKEIAEKAAPVQRLSQNFRGELLSRFDSWAKKNIEKEGPSVFRATPSRAHFRLESNGTLDLEWTPINASTLENRGSETAFSPDFWESADLSEHDRRSVVLSEIVALTKDYSNAKLGKSALPKDVSARSYAEIIRGLSRIARAFREWDKNSVDQLVGGYRAQELFPEFEMPELDRPLFPKDAFFALSFSSLSEFLKSITEQNTQVFLVDINNKVSWANESQSEGQTSSVMAGVTDRKANELSPIVRAEDVSRYLIALCEFIEATRFVEKSTSPYLLTPGPDGKIPRDEIIEGRGKIKLLAFGLANYLSNRFRAGGELIARWLEIRTQQPFDKTITVLDQAVTIRALIAASDALHTDIYRWEATDLVSAMNRGLYRPELGFYARPGERTISAPVLVETLRALDAASPYLTPASRAQIDHLTGVWKNKIANWHLSSEIRASQIETASSL
jgi:hypothetical protein